jgi:hypothetical protein
VVVDPPGVSPIEFTRAPMASYAAIPYTLLLPEGATILENPFTLDHVLESSPGIPYKGEILSKDEHSI